jgi:hypothetical protein
MRDFAAEAADLQRRIDETDDENTARALAEELQHVLDEADEAAEGS